MSRRLLLFSFVLLATLTSSAADVIQLRGCRVGTHNPQFTVRRAPSQQDGENPYIGELLMSKPVTQMYVDDEGQASFVFMDGETTAINESAMANKGQRSSAEWYLLDGRKLPAKPTTPGLYIHEGRKVAY